MGLIYAEIELINGDDFYLALDGRVKQENIRKINLKMRIDNSSPMLTINEPIQEMLQLPIVERRKVELANAQVIECDVASPVEVRFKNRKTTCCAIILPGDAEPVLGFIPIGGMDVVIDSQRQELTVNPNHPDMASTHLKIRKWESVS